ncbi:MAG: site-2 protease family protein [Planctomycetota bacterium]|nr:MAG: site-2 protease family protein [Planctomycetota bacterium]
MGGTKGSTDKYSRLALLVIIVAVAAYYISGRLVMWWNIFLAVMGFSAVVFIHECGHFIFAKLSDIKVEVFSVFLPPVLLGVRRTEAGWRIRILPKFFPKEGDESGDGLLSFTVGKGGKAGETEYRIGLIPVAGYVKMLGQEDTGADKKSDDPRSFGNKSVPARMAVIAAGVIFNVIAAIGILMIVYLVGINRMPAVVGSVLPGSPAARAGLRAGDEIVEISGKSDNLDFGNIMVAAVLSDEGEEVRLKARRTDGSVEGFGIVAEEMAGVPLRRFGIMTPQTLKLGEVSMTDANELFERTGLRGGDVIKSVNGRDVQEHWQLVEIVEEAFEPTVTVLAERVGESGEVELVESEIGLTLNFERGGNVEEPDLGNIYSIVPRLQITDVSKVEIVGGGGSVESGDVIVGIGGIENPTYEEMREVTEEHEGKELVIEVLRVDSEGAEDRRTATVVPKRSKDDGRVVIGIVVGLELERAVVGRTVAVKGGRAAAIPGSAEITAVGGISVSNFYDVAREMGRYLGQSVTIDYRVDEQTAGSVVLDLSGEDFAAVKTTLAEIVPFEPLERLYKAEGVVDAFVMGSKKSVWFIVQTYVTLKGLLARSISMEAMSGPVGIAAMSYKAVEHSFISFLYLLAFISANLAVINFLPIPVVDGGVCVLLIVERIKGRPVSVRVQEAISYAGLALIAMAFLYLTYNDIINFFRYR